MAAVAITTLAPPSARPSLFSFAAKAHQPRCERCWPAPPRCRGSISWSRRKGSRDPDAAGDLLLSYKSIPCLIENPKNCIRIFAGVSPTLPLRGALPPPQAGEGWGGGNAL